MGCRPIWRPVYGQLLFIIGERILYHPIGRANSLLLLVGLIVPVEDAEEAEDADEESSSERSVGSSGNASRSSSSSSRSTSGSGRTGGSPANFAFAKALWSSLILTAGSWR